MMNGCLTGLIYGLAALGLSLIFTVTRVINFAHGGLMAIGLTGASMVAARHNFDHLLAMPAVAAVLFFGGFLAYRLIIGRIAATPEHLRTLVMLGLALILVAGLMAQSGTPAGADAQVSRPIDGLAFGPLLLDRITLRAALMAGIITALLALFFNIIQTGKAIRACADSPFGARVIGLSVERLQAATFGLGAAITGIAGCLLTQNESGRAPLNADFLTLGVIVALTGGLGSVEGALVGGMAIGIAEALSGALLTPPLKELGDYAVIVLVLIARPHGLLGHGSTEHSSAERGK